MTSDVFDILMLIARPASGKSETIHYLKNLALAERQERFHTGELAEIDDFPMLWTWFEEDELLDQMGKPRLHTTAEGYFLWPYLWNLLIRRISLEYRKSQRETGAQDRAITSLIEFARGKEHGGYRSAFEHLSREILEKAAILYIDVSYAESLRKNRKRFNPNRPDSVLEHGLSDEKMERLYKETDWDELTGGASQGRLKIQGIEVPFVVFQNEDDVTTTGGDALGERLRERLDTLWYLRREFPNP